MTTIAHETTERSPTVRGERRPAPVQPRQYSYDFADHGDVASIAALGGPYSLATVRASLAEGEDEWIVARRGRTIVAAVRVRTAGPWRTREIDTPAVAEQHRRCGLERYLTHLAEIWIQSLGRAVAA